MERTFSVLRAYRAACDEEGVTRGQLGRHLGRARRGQRRRFLRRAHEIVRRAGERSRR